MIQKTEIFNIDRAKYILEHYSEFENAINTLKHDNDINTLSQLDKYIKRAKIGENGFGNINVNYHQTNPRGGRFFADGSLSLQGITRVVRHTIAYGIYTDIDMVNAHPVILQHIYKLSDLNNKCPELDDYIINRELRLQEIIDNPNAPEKYKTRSGAKQYYLILTNSGSDNDKDEYEKSYSDHSKKYRKEMKTIHDHFVSKFPSDFEAFKKYRTEKRGKTNNMKAAFMNILLCDFENKILQNLLKHFGDNNNAVLCHDGLMLPGKKEDFDLIAAELFIYDSLQIKIKLVVKEFSNGIHSLIDGSTIIPKYIPERFEYFTDYSKFTGTDNENTLEFLNEWVTSTCSLVANSNLGKAGDGELLVTKNVENTYCGGMNQKLIYYSVSPAKYFISSINRTCLVLNPQYDKTFYESNEHLAKSNPIWKDNRMKKYLFEDLKDYLLHMQKSNKISFYTSIVYIPYLRENIAPLGAFNIFRGFPNLGGKPSNINIEDSVTYKMILNDFCNGNLNEMKHLITTLADKVQLPANARRNGHIFISEEGTGKGLFARLISNVFGKHNVAVIGDTSRYFEKFNSLTTEKLFKIFEENGSGGAAYKFSELLKAQMTEDDEKVERKGKDQYLSINCACIIAYSNHMNNILNMQGSASRYTVHHINGIHANDIEYFKLIIKEINDPEYCCAFFHYLANFKYDVNEANRCFENDAKKYHKRTQLKSGYKFIIEKIENIFRDVNFENFKKDDKIFRFPVNELNKDFKDTYHFGNEGTLMSQLSSIGITSSCYKIHRGGNVAARCVILHPPSIEKALQDYMKDPDFKIDFSFIEDKDDEDNTILTIEYYDEQIKLEELKHKRIIAKLKQSRDLLINQTIQLT